MFTHGVRVRQFDYYFVYTKQIYKYTSIAYLFFLKKRFPLGQTIINKSKVLIEAQSCIQEVFISTPYLKNLSL